MKYQNKTVIASKRNSNAVRVFIPEKLRVNGDQYVQPYKFMRISASSQSMIVTLRDELNLFVSILRNEVVVTAPFTMSLIRKYLDDLNKLLPKYSEKRFKILASAEQREDGETWDQNFLKGKGKFVPS